MIVIKLYSPSGEYAATADVCTEEVWAGGGIKSTASAYAKYKRQDKNMVAAIKALLRTRSRREVALGCRFELTTD